MRVFFLTLCSQKYTDRARVKERLSWEVRLPQSPWEIRIWLVHRRRHSLVSLFFKCIMSKAQQDLQFLANTIQVGQSNWKSHRLMQTLSSLPTCVFKILTCSHIRIISYFVLIFLHIETLIDSNNIMWYGTKESRYFGINPYSDLLCKKLKTGVIIT